MTPFGEPPKGPSSDRVFNNADSFAQAFDEAWEQHKRAQAESSLDERTDAVLLAIDGHPFAREQPELARQVAQFRIRLLGL